jgi:hypothetical protein
LREKANHVQSQCNVQSGILERGLVLSGVAVCHEVCHTFPKGSIHKFCLLLFEIEELLFEIEDTFEHDAARIWCPEGRVFASSFMWERAHASFSLFFSFFFSL